jgi:hypothetical protein
VPDLPGLGANIEQWQLDKLEKTVI